MKLLSIAIPSYNSESYMEKCIKSLLTGGEAVEILIVDDGSKDHTAEIADRWAQKYPTIIKAIHQENAGHGGAVNTGIQNATGKYFKVVDSDDWVDQESYRKILSTLKEFSDREEEVDLLISNFVYDKQGAKRKKIMHYRHIFPAGEIFTWKEVGIFPIGKYLLMHSLIYRTEILRECGLQLPKHTFYVDNIFAFDPLPYVKKMYYLDVNFYRYYIGRDDQSVHESVMIRRIDQQLLVNRLMAKSYAENDYHSKKVQKYMYRYLEIITTISSIMLLISGTEENLKKKAELWADLKATDRKMYWKLRTGFLGIAMNLPGKLGRKFTVKVYKIVQKKYGFN